MWSTLERYRFKSWYIYVTKKFECSLIYTRYCRCRRLFLLCHWNFVVLWVCSYILQARRKWGAGGALVPPVFGQTVNPISTRGANYAHHSNTSPPDFQTLRRPWSVYGDEETIVMFWTFITRFGKIWSGKAKSVYKMKALFFIYWGENSVLHQPQIVQVLPITLCH